MLNTHKNKILSFVFLLVLIDRYFWSGIAQWREDQAASIWMGYIYPISKIKVGIFSSFEIPNPNGVALFSKFLALMPNLFWSGYLFGLISIILMFCLSAIFLSEFKERIILLLCLLSSVVLRGCIGDIGNCYFYIPLNLAFLSVFFRYLKAPSFNLLFAGLALGVVAPTFYLAGPLNTLAYCFMLGIAYLKVRPPKNSKWLLPMSCFAIVCFFTVLYTWWPFLHSIDLLKVVAPTNKVGLFLRLKRIAGVLFFLPEWLFQWDLKTFHPALIADETTLSESSKLLGVIYYWVMKFFGISTLLAFTIATVEAIKLRKIKFNESHWILLFIVVVFASNVALGNYRWHRGEYKEQSSQLYSAFILLFLSSHYWINSIKIKNGFKKMNLVLGLAFILVNVSAGVFMLRDVNHYQGPVVTGMDVPLVQREAALNWVVSDFRKDPLNLNANQIEIENRFCVEKFSWIQDFGHHLDAISKGAYACGKWIDYELVRVYGLHNSQENIQDRFWNSPSIRYVLSYSAFPFDTSTCKRFTNTVLGRITVTKCAI